jgi:hypothetical protein
MYSAMNVMEVTKGLEKKGDWILDDPHTGLSYCPNFFSSPFVTSMTFIAEYMSLERERDP